ncbi:class I SAM-dependent DNA methyltransferase [Salibacterium sp. K-3]
METYSGFARVYDRLMEEAPYAEWISWATGLMKNEEVPPQTILDAGCGTGTMLLALLDLGYEAEGLDLSGDMLEMAQQKLESRGYAPALFQRDMRHFHIPATYDVVLSFCDSLNYVTEETDLFNTFQTFYNHLNEGGSLLFDVHSVRYVEEVLMDFSFADAAEDAAYIWNVVPSGRTAEVHHELSLFIHDQHNQYRRFDEQHRQRAFPVASYRSYLEQSGFKIRGIYGDFTWNPPGEDADRIFFHAEKPVQNRSAGIN